MPRTLSTSIRAAVLTASILVAACGPAATDTPSPASAAAEIEAMLHASARDWTGGDLDGFLDDYAPNATFVGSSGLVEGRERIREGYVRGYWSTGMPADGLRFSALDIRAIGPDAALAVGRYELFDRETTAVTSSGLFSLILQRTADGWTIVHDHSSEEESG